MGVITANYVLAAAFFLPMLTLIIERLPREEQMMLDAFGDEYRDYMRKTGRLLPRIRQGDSRYDSTKPKWSSVWIWARASAGHRDESVGRRPCGGIGPVTGQRHERIRSLR